MNADGPEIQDSASATSRRAVLAAGFAVSAGCLRLSEDQQTGGNTTQSGDGGETEDDGASETSSRIRVGGSVGDVDEDGRQVVAIRQTVQRAADAGEIDLSELSIQYTSSGGSTMVVHASRGTPGFYLSPVVAEQEDNAVLTAAGDRYRVAIPLVSSNLVSTLSDEDPVDGTQLVENATLQALDEGATATLELTTASGATTTVNVAVPETVEQSAGGAVQL